MPERGIDNLLVIGAGAVDRHLPVGVATPGHEPGGKTDIADLDRYEAELDAAFALAQRNIGEIATRQNIVQTGGGNGRNIAVRAKKGDNLGGAYDVRFLSVHGKDEASHLIRANLLHNDIDDVSVEDPEHVASVSYIERLAANSDRHIRGLPRRNMGLAMKEHDIRSHVRDADVVVVTSLKSNELNTSAFRALYSEDIRRDDPQFVTFLPGSSEFKKHPVRLVNAMRHRQPNLLAGNETELAQLLNNALDTSVDTGDYEKLACEATRFSEYAVCTAGLKGIFIARQGRRTVTYHEARKVNNVVDTTGAGDSVAWTITDGLRRMQLGEDISEKYIAERAAFVGSTVVQHLGATGDLETR